MDKYRIVLTCWDYGKPDKPYVDSVPGFFDSKDAADAAIDKCVADELETLNSGRDLVPVIDSDGEVVAYDYDFRADECSDHANCIRFWDGDDYQEVTHYDIYPVQFHNLRDGTPSEHSCNYRGFGIYANKNHNRFKIEQYDTCLATKHTLQSALTWVDDLCLTVERSKSPVLKEAFAPKSSLAIVIKNAEEKATAASSAEKPVNEPERG